MPIRETDVGARKKKWLLSKIFFSTRRHTLSVVLAVVVSFDRQLNVYGVVALFR